MKSKYLVLSSLVLSACLLSGCDMLRSLAGRPTSKDIGVMRVEIIEEEKRLKAEADSLFEVQKDMKDREAAMDSLKAIPGNVLRPSNTLNLREDAVSDHYTIIIGAFKDDANAARFAARAQEAGYPAKVIPFRSGLNAVGVCGTSDEKAVYESLKAVRNEPFCPKDVWILVKE